MKAIEFEGAVSRDGQIIVPSYVDDAVWREAGRRQFEESYCAEDSIYEQLAANDVPDR